MQENEENKNDGNVTGISVHGKEPEAPARALDSDTPPTHYALDVRTVADLRKFLGTQPHDDVALLIMGIQNGVPLQLGPKEP